MKPLFHKTGNEDSVALQKIKVRLCLATLWIELRPQEGNTENNNGKDGGIISLQNFITA